MQYGTGISEAAWADLMSHARKLATVLGVRIKIEALINGPRQQRFLGKKYLYLIMAPTEVGTPRCGEVGPIGKPCIRYKSHYSSPHSVLHICRTNNPYERMGWGTNYPTQVLDTSKTDWDWTGELK